MKRHPALILGLTLAVWPVQAFPQSLVREYVLKQVKVPHHYYWREMYVPQVTSGPSAMTWSPDGTELIYSMQGSLWRQRVGSDTARQLTDDPGYDYQPDWSPDGQWVVFSRYRNDQIELWLLDLTRGREGRLLGDGSVNLEARWSPDGARLAFVSTAFEGRWHIFVAPFDHGTLGTPVRITEDHNSGLPRYYYSIWDHYLSPTWSPDSKELILVSNRGRVMGTGGFWRVEARLGAPMREIWYEETTWKAHPDWAHDGRRVVYSGYHGRQWNQLWLMTSEGGDPFQLTYGEFDATNPRWSPDGQRIAFTANAECSMQNKECRGVSSGTLLRVVEIPGGKQIPVRARHRVYLRPCATLRLSVTDSTGRALSSRIAVIDSTGRSWAPDSAWRHADEAFVRGEQAVEYGYFHSDGSVTLSVPPGRYQVEVWKGPEYRVARKTLTITGPAPVQERLVLARLFNLPANGWWGGDLHVHMNYGGHYRNTPANLMRQARAEGLHVVENLIVNKEQRIPDIAYWRPGTDSLSTRDFVLAHAEEYHTSFWGHSALLGLQDYFVLPNYAGYANTGGASLVPMNGEVFDRAHAQGGIVGYVHPFDSRPDPFNRDEAVRYEMPIDVALGKVDYFEVMGYSDHLITSEFWYRLLNCGFKIPAAAGTDAFPNFASLRGPPGLVRVYARTDGPLEHRAWLAAIKAGRTFVTNAPILGLGWRVVGPSDRRTVGPWYGIGDSLSFPAGQHSLEVQVSLRSNTPVDHLELVRNGRVVAEVKLAGDRTSTDSLVRLPVSSSGWYVVRAWSDRPRLPVLDLYPFASTSPFYVTVGGQPVRSREDADYMITWIDRVRAEVEKHTGWNTAAEREQVLTTIASARRVFETRR
jgi:Tol biopolymer transport system component